MCDFQVEAFWGWLITWSGFTPLIGRCKLFATVFIKDYFVLCSLSLVLAACVYRPLSVASNPVYNLNELRILDWIEFGLLIDGQWDWESELFILLSLQILVHVEFELSFMGSGFGFVEMIVSYEMKWVKVDLMMVTKEFS